MVTIGLGTIEAPQVFAKMSLAEFKRAFELVGNYRNLPQPERDKALNDDYELIQSANPKREKAQKAVE